jgi:hypothetical protein
VKLIDCVCDGCGKMSSCAPDEHAPRNWYYAVDTDGDVLRVIACSKACQAKLQWKRQRSPS